MFDGDGDGVPFFYDADEFAAELPPCGGGFHLIRNVYQLQAIAGVDHRGQAIAVFGADDGECRLNNYRLAGDIDAALSRSDGWQEGSGFFPIAYGDSFTGNFDGADYEIRDLFIDRRGDGMAGVGLFGNLGRNAMISNVRLENAQVAGGDDVGALVGRVGGDGVNRVRIENSRARGDVFGSGDNVGGLVGSLLNLGDADIPAVAGSWFAGRVRGVSNVGGLIGQAGDSVARNNFGARQLGIGASVRRDEYQRQCRRLDRLLGDGQSAGKFMVGRAGDCAGKR